MDDQDEVLNPAPDKTDGSDPSIAGSDADSSIEGHDAGSAESVGFVRDEETGISSAAAEEEEAVPEGDGSPAETHLDGDVDSVSEDTAQPNASAGNDGSPAEPETAGIPAAPEAKIPAEADSHLGHGSSATANAGAGTGLLRPRFAKPGWSDRSADGQDAEFRKFIRPAAAFAVFIIVVSVTWFGISRLMRSMGSGSRRISSSGSGRGESGSFPNGFSGVGIHDRNAAIVSIDYSADEADANETGSRDGNTVGVPAGSAHGHRFASDAATPMSAEGPESTRGGEGAGAGMRQHGDEGDLDSACAPFEPKGGAPRFGGMPFGSTGEPSSSGRTPFAPASAVFGKGDLPHGDSDGLVDASEQVEYIVDYLLSNLSSSGDRVETLSRASRTFGGSGWKWVEKKIWALDPARLVRRMSKFFEKSSFELLGSAEGEVPGSTVLSIGFNGKPMLELLVTPRKTTRALAAIIIDDVGYGGKAGDEIMSMPPVLTLSVLPGERLSMAAAELARKKGFEVMLHQPMEGSSKSIRLGPGGLVTNLSDTEILARFRKNLDGIPGAAGVNNHMGSVFTANRSRMKIILEEIRRRKLFFIDSRTSVDTVAEEEAAALGVPAWRRHVFLDNDVSPSAISRQIGTLIEMAKKEGAAIGIGHAHVETIRTIRSMLPEFEKSGVRLVHAGDILKSKGLSYGADMAASPSTDNNTGGGE